MDVDAGEETEADAEADSRAAAIARGHVKNAAGKAAHLAASAAKAASGLIKDVTEVCKAAHTHACHLLLQIMTDAATDITAYAAAFVFPWTSELGEKWSVLVTRLRLVQTRAQHWLEQFSQRPANSKHASIEWRK